MSDINARRWTDALLGASLFAIAPLVFQGVHLRSRPGPAQEVWLDYLRSIISLDTSFRRLPASVSEERLLGGMDLAATLSLGKLVHRDGILAECDGDVVITPMADRMDLNTVCTLASAFDMKQVRIEKESASATLPASFALIAIDEHDENDNKIHPILYDRLSICLDLEGFSLNDLSIEGFSAEQIESARRVYPSVKIKEASQEVIVGLGLRMGLVSLRPIIFASGVACAHAALSGRMEVEENDLLVAARLVLLPRATVLPDRESAEDEIPPEMQEQSNLEDNINEDKSVEKPLEDRVMDAVIAEIPADLLAQIRSGQPKAARGAKEGKAGDIVIAKRRGRPAGVRRSPGANGQRLNIIETLRAAAPLQRLRHKSNNAGRVRVLRDDFRYTRFKHQSETTVIFVVDASGSSALHRLAEIKGAVQIVLAECYVRRDEIALISFRGKGAELLLPPTRSLVRAKRQLIGLPGGGGTPLASGLQSAALIADGARRKGRIPVIVVMTDGSANVALDGKGGRSQAEADALNTARMISASGINALMIDTANRPREQAKKIAEAMQGSYLPLPHAKSEGVANAVKTAVSGDFV